MLTLGIETSCDETSCAVLEGLHTPRSNIISSSLFRHKPFGGIVPEIASRHCLEQIDCVLGEALKKARVKLAGINLIAVTQGPGLIGSLLVGISFAKALGFRLGVPVIGVNHLEAHLASNFIGNKEPKKYIGLLVSGGHTSLSYHEGGRMKILGETVDDAVGEAFDKVAKILKLGFPGGPVIDALAKEGDPAAVKFTAPKQKNGSRRRFNFSFSGIKTAVLYHVENIQGFRESGKPGRNIRIRPPQAGRALKISRTVCRNIAASFQKAVVTWLVEKTIAAAHFKKVRDIVVGGGVSANSHLRSMLEQAAAESGFRVWFPPLALTGDNALMIARRGLELYRQGHRTPLDFSADPNIKFGSSCGGDA